MSYFTFSGNKLVMTALAAGALAVGGTGVAAMADSHGDTPVAPITESPAPDPTETEAPEPTPTETETESPDPEPTGTETAEPEPTDDPEPEPTETGDPEESPTATPVGPDVTGPAAVGLCNAFEHGGLSSTSTAYTVLMEVAGGDEAIVDYCATIPAPQDIDDGSVDDGTDGGTDDGEGTVQPQNVELQNEGAPASNGANGGHGSPGSSGGAGHQGNSAKHSHHG